MKRVKSFNIARMKKGGFLAFLQAVITRSQRDETVMAMFEKQVNALAALYGELETLAQRHQINLLTEEVVAADAERDKAFRFLRNLIKALCEAPVGEKKQAAELLWKVTKEVGMAHSLQYDVESGTLTAYCLDLLENHSAEVELLGIKKAVEDLKKANDDFIKVLAERTESQAGVEKGEFQEMRNRAMVAYRGFVSLLNAELYANNNETLVPFANYLNAEIERQRIALGQSTASSTEDVEGAPRMRTATFKMTDGRVEKFKLEVGAPLVAPQNTPGYHWKPEVPEVMPEKSTTYREVENRKVKLTFHFIDHREDVVEALSGALMTFPMNTLGCKWDPEIPATVPDEDTSYYEVLVPIELEPVDPLPIG